MSPKSEFCFVVVFWSSFFGLNKNIALQPTNDPSEMIGDKSKTKHIGEGFICYHYVFNNKLLNHFPTYAIEKRNRKAMLTVSLNKHRPHMFANIIFFALCLCILVLSKI